MFGGDRAGPKRSGSDIQASNERLNSRDMDQRIKAKTLGILEPELYFHKNVTISFDVLDHDPDADFNVMLQMEPPAILDITQAIIDHQNVFDLILAWNEEVLEKCENSVFLPFGTCWIDEHDQAIHAKTKLLSVIASEKKDTKGHKLRHKIIAIDKALDSRDVYGRGYSPIENKITALKDYMFSVVIENSTPKNYFTEKTIDCLATGTVPVFWGCENIEDFFDIRGFVFFKSAKEYKKIRPTLTAETYNQMLPYIKKNFELSLKYTNYLDRVEAEINKIIQSV